MTSIARNALLPYSQQQVYALVNDVATYPQYMDGCVGVEIISSTDECMVARLDLARAGITTSFTTRNTLEPHAGIILTLEDGPFNLFEGNWKFIALAPTACKVHLALDFTLSSKLASVAVGKLIDSVASGLVDSLCVRAKHIYG